MQDKQKFTLNDIFWYSPLLLAVILSFVCEVETSFDSGIYLQKAHEFSLGKIDLTFRPGFSALLGGAFSFLGTSMLTAAIFTRFFYIAIVTLIFFWAQYLFDKKVAFASAILLIFSFELNFISMRAIPHIDSIHPFFVFLSLFVSTIAVDKKSITLAFVAFFLLFFSYTVKLTVIPFIFFPPLYALFYSSSNKKHQNYRINLSLAITIISVISIYLYGSFTKDGSGPATYVANSFFTIFLSGNPILTILDAAFKTLDKFFFRDQIMGGIFLLSWIWIFFSAFRNLSSRGLLLIFILFSPALLYLGMSSFRIQQAAPILLISFIPIALLFNDFACVLSSFIVAAFSPSSSSKKTSVKKYTYNLIFLFFIISASIYQLMFSSNQSLKWLQKSMVTHALSVKLCSFKMEGRLLSTRKSLFADILEQNAKKDDSIWIGPADLYDLAFLTNYQFHLLQVPTQLVKNIYTLAPSKNNDLPSVNIKGNLLFLWPAGWKNSLTYHNTAGEMKLLYIDEATLEKDFSLQKPSFIMLDRRFDHLGSYFSKMPGVKILSTQPKAYRIKTKHFNRVPFFAPRVAYDIGLQLRELSTRYPRQYEWVKKNVFVSCFNFTPEQVDGLADLDAETAGVIFIGFPGRNYRALDDMGNVAK